MIQTDIQEIKNSNGRKHSRINQCDSRPLDLENRFVVSEYQMKELS